MSHRGLPGIPARYWHLREDVRVECDLCPRACALKPGQNGFCAVRGRTESGEMRLHAYGRTSGFAVDPIEKKPLYHFHPGTFVLSYGTIGCNLGCKFCQNWHMSRADGRLRAEASPADVVALARREQCEGIAFTYNDPVISAEYTIDTAREARKAGLYTVAVSAGYIQSGAREEFFADIDAANIDLKGFTEDFYRRWALGSLAPVLETLKYLKTRTKVWLEITTLLIPGLNDDPGDLDRMIRWIAGELGPDVPLHFSAFHPDYKLVDRPRTPLETLLRAREIARANGIRRVHLGNVPDPEQE